MSVSTYYSLQINNNVDQSSCCGDDGINNGQTSPVVLVCIILNLVLVLINAILLIKFNLILILMVFLVLIPLVILVNFNHGVYSK